MGESSIEEKNLKKSYLESIFSSNRFSWICVSFLCECVLFSLVFIAV
jgi:hypothetical protein